MMERACTELLERVAAYVELRDTAADGGVAVLDALAQVEVAMPLWRQTAGDWRPLIEAVVGWWDVDGAVTPILAERNMTRERARALRRCERRLFVPALNTEITLAEPWTFTLHYEDRNTAVWAAAVCQVRNRVGDDV
jgi:hypothetical protein